MTVEEKVDLRIRKGVPEDLPAIMACYELARQYMRSSGNPSQWVNGYPARELILDDMTNGFCYVGTDENDEIAMTFAFIIGDDPTYARIEDGEWPDNRKYGTIHRLASTGKYRGILENCINFCFSKIDTLRLDTHADNAIMLSGVARLGFTRCGIIHCVDGTPRIAFQKTL